MTIHYHGTPIKPRPILETLAGKAFCVSFYDRRQIARCSEIGDGLMLDNGAYSMWTRELATDWPKYYRWVERWSGPKVWAVIPDVIGGDEADNDRLIAEWPSSLVGAPVWHMHESILRLCRLAEKWPRVCIGSSGDFRLVGSMRWHQRMTEAMNMLCGDGPPPVELHMMRGMIMAGSIYPFASVDSTDLARNHVRKRRSALNMAKRWEAAHCPTTWQRRPTQHALPI